MTMTRRFVDHGIPMLAVAVLLAVISSPIRPTSASQPPPNYLPRNFAIPDKIGHSGQFAMSAPLCLRQSDSVQSDIADELDADIEDELTVTSPPASVSFEILPAPCPRHYSRVVRFAIPLAARPLRC